ncbi:M20/M25/M40 family metallo-hydrolase [Methanocella arvoryzae]|uniref:M20/M25/M40 family metallo-hydrolase n=1 Tax=Methanocella arvoryzae TaxID=1175445 RepID=UPI0009DB5D79|nr:M20/M25/M40 family metallo-hydrolase [Methanocella arvoryzae]
MPVSASTTRKPEDSRIVVPGRVLDILARNRGRYLRELAEFLEIPSVGADRRHTADMRRAAEWFLARVERSGFSGKVFETRGHPIVYAERWPEKAAPTLLVYGHYDVQPPGPLHAWKTLPFTPVVKDGAIYARGGNR